MEPHTQENETAVLQVCFAPGLMADLELWGDRLRQALDREYPGVHWVVRVVVDALVDPYATTTDLLDAAREALLDGASDLVVVLTDLPIRIGRRTVGSMTSTVRSVAIVSWPSLGPSHRQDRALEASLRTVAQLLGHDHRDGHVLHHPRSIAVRDRLGALIKLTPRHLGEEVDIELSGFLRLVAGMVATNQPWRVALTLTRGVAVALATVAFAVVTSDIWVLASHASTARQIVLGASTILLGTTALILQHGLWERSRGRETSRAQIRLFNLATTATVAIGFVALYAILVTVALIAAVVLVDGDTLVEVTGHDTAGVAEYAALAWFAGSLATLGAAVGAGLESDSAIREAAYATRPGTSAEAD